MTRWHACFSGIQPTGRRSTSATTWAPCVTGSPTSTSRRALLRGRPPRAHGAPGPGRAAGRDARAGRDRSWPPASIPTSAPCSSRATCTSTPSCRWLLECTASFGELRRMTQFKDKAEEQRRSCPAGLFTYPVLMAADILLYDTDRVPVGDDQRQHLELARDVADPLQRPLRRHVRDARGDHPQGRRADHGPAGPDQEDVQVRGLARRARSCCSRSPRASPRRSSGRSPTPRTEVRYDPDAKPGVSNLLELLGAATGRSPEAAAAGYTQYGPLKADTADAVVELLRPIQARYAELAADPAGTARRCSPRARPRPRRSRPTRSTGPRRNIGLLPRSLTPRPLRLRLGALGSPPAPRSGARSERGRRGRVDRRRRP